VAFTPSGDLVVFYPDSLLVKVLDPASSFSSARWSALLPGEYGFDRGREVFHRMTGAGLACASCHPEGREDGLVWEFQQLGVRRTQHVGGHILERAPYHWDGDMTDLGRLMNEVFAGRMGGGFLEDWEVLSLGRWLDQLSPPAAPAPTDPDAVARGRLLFDSAGCASCHSGAILTNNQRFDVGTGGMFKVPSLLGIGSRAPFLHTGCAPTLKERFTCGGGDQHGTTSNLSDGQIDDLVAYLETL
jgi:cytochrome c peroxidase